MLPAINKFPWHLFRLNLRWHLAMTKQFLLRYKITTLFLLLVLAPSITAIPAILIFPTKQLVLTTPTKLGLGLSIIGFQAIALTWFYMQHTLFATKPWKKYLQTLPISPPQNAVNEFGILLLVNLMMWLPLLLAAILEFQSNALLLFSKIALCATLILQMQIICEKQRYWILLTVVASDWVWFLNTFSPSATLQILLLLALVILNGIITVRLFLENPVKKSSTTSTRFYFRPFPLLRIQVNHLVKTQLSQLLLPIMNLFGLLLFTYYLAINIGMTARFGEIAADCLLLAALICSGFFKKLHRERQQHLAYSITLPISPRTWIFYDLLFASMILLITSLCLLAIAQPFSASRWLAMIAIGLSCLFSCYVPQIQQPRYGSLISCVIFCAFAFINHLIFGTL